MSESTTTIDKLSIEINSNAAQVKTGIEGLAIALGELKKNGSFGTAVKNLNNLSESLRKLTPVTSNANKLSALAKSVNELSKAGSFTRVVNQLNKLPGALSGLSKLNIDNDLGAKLEKLAQATTPLSNIKTGCLGTMVNALGKIGSVTKSLDDDTIGRFADRVKKLSDSLGPLSTKMTTVQAGLRGINSNAKTASVGISAFDGKVKTARLNLASLVTVVQGAVSALMPLVRLFSDTISQAIEWDGVAARFGRGFGDQAGEVYSWIQRLNQEMGINVQQFMQYSSVFSTMLQGFGVSLEDSSKMALGYTELVYDIWAGYNDVYKNFGDAADAVKSAIAGEVEPIRRAGFTIVEATLEQTAANHGLTISLENATEAQKSYLRYLTLVDQAHAQGLVGTYAKELGTAEGVMRTFSQQLKSLAQTFGSIFLPILVKVMPWLQAFVELLTEAIVAVAGFFGIDIQPVKFESTSNGLGGITESAGAATEAVDKTTGALKDLKNATLGIDELNVISPPTESGGTGAAGGAGGGFDGLGIESLWDESIFNNIQTQVRDLKEEIKGFITESPVVALAGFVAGLVGLAKAVTAVKSVWSFMTPVVTGIKEYVAAVKMMTPEVGLFNAMFPKLSGHIATFSAGISKAWGAVTAFLGGISAPVWAAIVAAIVALIGTIVFLKENWDEVTAAAKRFFDENIGPKIDSIKENFQKMGEALGPVGDAISAAWQWLKDFINEIGLLDGVKAVFEGIGFVVVEVFGGLIAGAFQSVMGVIDGFVQTVTGVVEIFSGIVQAIVALCTGDLTDAKDACDMIADGIIDVFEGLYNMTIGPIVDFVEGIIDWCTYLWDELVGHSIIPDTIDGIVDCFLGLPGEVLGTVGEFVEDIIEKFTDFGSKIVEKVSSGWNTVKSWWKGKKDLETAKVDVGLEKDGWTSVKDWVGKMPTLSAGIKLVKDGWSSIKSWLGSLNFNIGFKLPKIGINWGSKTFAGFKISYPTGFYTYAKGGFPDVGELFIAREAGPEMVGKMGNKTTVANNQQIVDGISEGVYAAVLAAMRQSEGNGGQSVNVYLDGRQITSAVEKRQRERGATIMRNGVYAY